MRKHVVLVEDDEDQAVELLEYLAAEGFDVDWAQGGQSFEALLAASEPDLVVMDLMLGDESGLELIQQLRRTSNTPVLVLSGRTDPIERVVGLEIGADDYITKPFHPRELLARLRAVLRRTSGTAQPAAARAPGGENFEFEGLRLYCSERQLVDADGNDVELSSALFRLLELGVRHPGIPLSRQFLTQSIYGRRWDPLDRCIDNLAGRLRRHLAQHGIDRESFKSIRGVGYAFSLKVTPLDERPGHSAIEGSSR